MSDKYASLERPYLTHEFDAAVSCTWCF